MPLFQAANRGAARRRAAALLAVCLAVGAARRGAAQHSFSCDRPAFNARKHYSRIDFSRDSRLLAMSLDTRTIEVWDLSDGKTAAVLKLPSDDGRSIVVGQIHFLGDGRTLAAVFLANVRREANQGEVALFDVSKRERRAWIEMKGKDVAPHCIAFSPDGKAFVMAHAVVAVGTRGHIQAARQEVTVHNAATGEEVTRLDTAPSCSDILFSPDGQWLATVHGLSPNKGQVILWDAATFERRRTLRADGDSLWLAVSPDSKLVAASANQNTPSRGPALGVRIWKVETGQEIGWLAGYEPAERLRTAILPLFAPRGGMLLVSCYSDRPKSLQLKLWNTSTGEQTLLESASTPDSGPAAAFSPDGSWLATPVSGSAPGVKLWDTKDWRPLRTLELPIDGARPFPYVRHVKFSPDGKWLTAARAGPTNNKGEVVLWNLAEAMAASSTSRAPALD